MKKVILVSVVCLSLITVLSCTSNDLFEGPCDDLKGRIPEQLRIIYPYSINLKSIIFENEIGEEFDFQIINKQDGILVINEDKEFPFEAERLLLSLFNSKLNMYLHITMEGGYGTYNCPVTATRVSHISIRTPLEYKVPASNEFQSSNLIKIGIVDDKIEIPPSELESTEIAGDTYEQVYFGNGDIITYFNFDVGIVGFIDKRTSHEYKHKKTTLE